MSLITRCPQCNTAFRVQPLQLSAKGGSVRCGKCSTVFDGVSHLVTPEQPRPPERSPQMGLFDPGRAALRAAPAAAVAGPAAAPEAPEVPVVPFLAEPPPRRRYTAAWGVLACAAFLLLAGQAVHHFRTEIAVLLPQARPYLAAACARLGCEVGLPRRPELMSIESSELQADARREAVIVLSAVLRNRAPFVQAYPALELTLTDAAENPVARRVLLPADYLLERPGDGALPRGVPAGGEVVLRVPLDTRLVSATGYRLYLFFP